MVDHSLYIERISVSLSRDRVVTSLLTDLGKQKLCKLASSYHDFSRHSGDFPRSFSLFTILLLVLTVKKTSVYESSRLVDLWWRQGNSQFGSHLYFTGDGA